jgi:hypothetical protein
MRGMLTSSVLVIHYESARPHTAARTRALLDCVNWELFDRPPYSPDLAPSDCHVFTYLKKCLESQRFNNNEELMEGVKTWLSSEAATSLAQTNKNLFPDTRGASISALSMLRCSLTFKSRMTTYGVI